MKRLSIFCASFVALAALALTAEGASAAQFSVNQQRFDPYKLKANDPKGETDCTGKGGKVFTDKEGTKTCKDVQDNAVADTGKKTANPNSSGKTGGTTGFQATPDLDANANAVAIAHTADKGSKSNGPDKAGVTARTDVNRGVWKAPAGADCAMDKGSATGGAGAGKVTGDRAQQGRVQLDSDWNERHCGTGKGKTGKHESTMQSAPQPK